MWVPIDGVRVISNRSTGELGHILVKDLLAHHAKITLLEGPVTVRTVFKSNAVKMIKFYFYEEFVKFLEHELKKPYDAVIHLAAVSDYQPKKVYKEKLRSDLSELILRLVPTRKLIYDIKRFCPKAFLVGFKLESNKNLKGLKEKASRLFLDAHCDLVVANCVTTKSYAGYILEKTSNVLAKGFTRREISSRLTRILGERL